MSLALRMFFWNDADWVAPAVAAATYLSMLGIGSAWFLLVGASWK